MFGRTNLGIETLMRYRDVDWDMFKKKLMRCMNIPSRMLPFGSTQSHALLNLKAPPTKRLHQCGESPSAWSVPRECKEPWHDRIWTMLTHRLYRLGETSMDSPGGHSGKDDILPVRRRSHQRRWSLSAPFGATNCLSENSLFHAWMDGNSVGMEWPVWLLNSRNLTCMDALPGTKTFERRALLLTKLSVWLLSLVWTWKRLQNLNPRIA